MCHATFGHIPIPKLAKFRAPTGIVLEDGIPTPDHWKSPIFRWSSYSSPQNYSGCCSNHQIINVFISTSPIFRKTQGKSSRFPSFSIIFPAIHQPFPCPTVSFQAGSGTMEHLHGRLAQLRDDVAQVSLQRDQAQMQVKLLQAELDAWKSGKPWDSYH